MRAEHAGGGPVLLLALTTTPTTPLKTHDYVHSKSQKIHVRLYKAGEIHPV